MSTKRAYPPTQGKQKQLQNAQARALAQGNQSSKMMNTKESFEFIWRKIMEMDAQMKNNMVSSQPVSQPPNGDMSKLKQEINKLKKELTTVNSTLTQLQMSNITLRNELDLVKNNSSGLKTVEMATSLVSRDKDEDEEEEVDIGFSRDEEDEDE